MQASVADNYTGKIPRILHYIYLSGFDAYIAETQKPRAKLLTWYRDTCMEVHKHWEIKFWTEEMAYELVSTKFPEFLPIWNTYDMEVGTFGDYPVSSCSHRTEYLVNLLG